MRRILHVHLFHFRIAKALKSSESYNQANSGNGNISRNRTTVVRTQSKRYLGLNINIFKPVYFFLINLRFDMISIHVFFIFLVAVIVCFLACWTPYHVQRMMFVFVTKADTWSPTLFEAQETLHVLSGM
jgi:hypothetical protein